MLTEYWLAGYLGQAGCVLVQEVLTLNLSLNPGSPDFNIFF